MASLAFVNMIHVDGTLKERLSNRYLWMRTGDAPPSPLRTRQDMEKPVSDVIQNLKEVEGQGEAP